MSAEEFYDSYIVSVEGHAGFGECGSDIVCAAVSAITFTLLNALKCAEDDGCLFIRTESVSDGSVYIVAQPYDFAREKVGTIIETCMTGFLLLEEEYPDYIEISG